MNTIEEILDEFEEAILQAREPKSAIWIFQRRPTTKPYIQAIQKLIDEATTAAKSEIIDQVFAAQNAYCTCRCRLHTQHGCPKCLVVEKCALHFEPDPASLQKG